MITVKEFFDPKTSTLTYCVWDNSSKDAVVIDPVMDYDELASKVSFDSTDNVTSYIKENSLTLHFVLETHAHADHLSAAQEFKKRFPKIKIGIGENIRKVQKTFFKIFNKKESNLFDLYFKDQERFQAGTLSIQVLNTPGHTPACICYYIEDALFTGDLLFMPDYGVGRCDFPNGSAEEMYDSVTSKVYCLPETTRLFTGHDYQPNGRPLKFECTLKEQKASNVHLNKSTTKESFIKFRIDRDKTLKAPRLLYQSLQVNIDAGRLPEPETNGSAYLKIPLM